MRSERGFSLVELMVAMTVTLIVSGAIYGLLTSGSNAFRREPEVADRQQNIRVAMDLISRDVFNAGAAMPTYSQVFTLADPAGACAGGLDGCGIPGALGLGNTDTIEMVSADERCATLTVCSTLPLAGSAGLFVTREPLPGCLALPRFVLLVDGGAQFSVQPAAVPTGGGACPSGGNAAVNGSLQLSAPVQPSWAPAVAFASGFVYSAQVVRYAIAASGDDQDPSPALWRSQSGRYTSAGVLPVPEGPPGGPWELVARGIEDLQFEYLYGSPTAAWNNRPPLSAANWGTLVREVRITLSARVTAANLQGQTQAAGGGAPDALRGQLSTTVAPRAAFNELQMEGQIQ